MHLHQNPSKLYCIDKLMLKFIWKVKRPRIANITVKKKNKVGIDITRLQDLL